MRFPPRHYLFIVMLGLDPSIQGDRSVVCPWTLGSSPRVTNGVVETASPQLHCHHPTVMLGLDPSIQGNRSIARPWPLGSSPRVTKKETRAPRREAVRVAVPSAAVLVVQRARVHLAVVGVRSEARRDGNECVSPCRSRG